MVPGVTTISASMIVTQGSMLSIVPWVKVYTDGSRSVGILRTSSMDGLAATSQYTSAPNMVSAMVGYTPLTVRNEYPEGKVRVTGVTVFPISTSDGL